VTGLGSTCGIGGEARQTIDQIAGHREGSTAKSAASSSTSRAPAMPPTAKLMDINRADIGFGARVPLHAHRGCRDRPQRCD